MRVLIYEFVTGGGWLEQDSPPGMSLASEGAAMLTAVAADFALLAGVQPVVMRDARLPALPFPGCQVERVANVEENLQVFEKLSQGADWTLLIAPETGGVLYKWAQRVETVGGRLLSPPPKCIELAANKQRTAELLAANHVQTPRGFVLTRANREKLVGLGQRLVAKPIDGCGSSGVRSVPDAMLATLPDNGSLRVEQFIAGIPVSVSVLCGPEGDVVLPACMQRLSQDGRFTYLGGSLVLERSLNARAQRLALAAVRVLQPRFGYLGMDLIIGSEHDGSQDFVIEVNPRLTTSYVGLRAATRCNLAGAMLAVCGGSSPQLEFDERPLEFTQDGQICRRELVK